MKATITLSATTAATVRSPLPRLSSLRQPARFRVGRGFSLVEALAAVAVGAVVLATAAPSMQATLERRHLEGMATRLAADLRQARSEAIAGSRPLRVSFLAEDGRSCYVVHAGPRAGCSCTGGRPQCSGDSTLLHGVAFDAGNRLRMHANVASIVFDPLHGTATPAGTVEVSAASGRAVRHVVNVLGRVRSCSPDGAVSGWPRC